MSTLAESLGEIKRPWQWIAVGGTVLLIWAVLALPNLRLQQGVPSAQVTHSGPSAEFYSDTSAKAKPVALAARGELRAAAVAGSPTDSDSVAGRKIIRTSSIAMVVQRPAEVADKITALAENMGGYLVSAEGGGQNATAGTLTIRVPASRFEEARADIRKLGLQVESEKIDAQDVTRQYVDQDASLRNLRAEETQYLAIMKQAATVKDMLAVSERLSEVRGQIEQQQAEFNTLSRQIETVALTVALRTEVQAQFSWLNWRPLYQLKLAVRDGLESVGDYAAAMTTMLFYLPAVLLWAGTILLGAVMGWRLLRWVGRRWFDWKATEAPARG